MTHRLAIALVTVLFSILNTGMAVSQEYPDDYSLGFEPIDVPLADPQTKPALTKQGIEAPTPASGKVAKASYEPASEVKLASSISIADCDSCADVCTSVRPRRWFATFENVIVQPLQSNSTGLIVEADAGALDFHYSHVTFPWELSYSPRIQLGSEAGGRSLGWRVRYWTFDHSQSFQANDANGLIPIGTEATVGYLSEDGDITQGIAFIREGDFQSSIRTDVIDFELQRQVAEPLDFYAGFRFAKADQGYLAVTDQGTVSARSQFRGVGPTMALRFSQTLPYESVSLFANLRGSFLFGKKEFTTVDDVNRSQQSIGVIDLRSYADGANTLANNAEIQLGLRYAPCNYFALNVAFECQTFGNVGGPNPTGVFTGPDSGLAGDGPLDDSLSFAGVTAGAELTW